MKIEALKALFDEENTNEIEWQGNCHDCGKETHVLAVRSGEEISVSGGAVYDPMIDGQHSFFVKCEDCFSVNSELGSFQPVETYSRVVGYLRPISQWNGGKVEEFEMRKNFKI